LKPLLAALFVAQLFSRLNGSLAVAGYICTAQARFPGSFHFM
jgi:hypothetical protein